MGNCISCCMVEPDEYKESEHMISNKRSEKTSLNKKEKGSYYDSCLY